MSNSKKPGEARKYSIASNEAVFVPLADATKPPRRRDHEWAKLAPSEARLLPFEQPGASTAERRRAADALRTLRELGFTNQGIQRLRLKLRQLAGVASVMNDWPTVGADRASLLTIKQQAVSLRQSLQGLYPMAAMQLAGRAHDLFDDELLVDNIEAALSQLMQAAQYAVEQMPAQGHPPSHQMFVFAVLRESEQLARPLKRSDSPKSRFHRACQAAFHLADVRREVKGQRLPVSPTAAIRAAMGNSRPPK